jgi:hydrogenase nickel insertion protein HypA
MHEFSLVEALLERVAIETRARQNATVRKLRLRIGESAGVELELFRAAYDVVRNGTPCEQATLEIVSSPVVWTCAACGSAVDPRAGLWCGVCRRPAELVSGDEIVLERIELEVA